MKEVSRQLAELSAKVDTLTTKVDVLDAKVSGHDAKFESIEAKFKAGDAKFDRFEKKMDDGFNASKIRDEELLGLSRLCLEADEMLRDSMVRRFDETDRKHNEQIRLLTDVTRYLGSHK